MADASTKPDHFEVDIFRSGNSAVVSFLGELDISNAEDMRRTFCVLTWPRHQRYKSIWGRSPSLTQPPSAFSLPRANE